MGMQVNHAVMCVSLHHLQCSVGLVAGSAPFLSEVASFKAELLPVLSPECCGQPGPLALYSSAD